MCTCMQKRQALLIDWTTPAIVLGTVPVTGRGGLRAFRECPGLQSGRRAHCWGPVARADQLCTFLFSN